ncbi:hypothetical protein JCM33374_g6009 [Metschnikowia sp. JCM 33374]|nr:hypothetical protein JCM33374_g6009 [Metschnikowia sp. JCM 33374]
MSRDALFPEEYGPSPGLISSFGQHPAISPVSSRSSIGSVPATVGDPIHELSDRQLYKLIAVKFNNDPLLLIRQISRDLVSKEAELILLRRESSKREHVLARLCTEYGNLSSLELDQRLGALKPDSDLHRALSNMIGSAVAQQQTPTNFVPPSASNTAAKRTPGSKASRRNRTHTSGTASESSQSAKHKPVDKHESGPSVGKHIRPDPRPASSGEFRSVSRSDNRLERSSSSSRRENTWLQWFKSPVSSSPSDSSSTKVLPENIARPRGRNDPVELNRISQPFDDDEVSISADSQTDRFGFYNNLPRSKGYGLVTSPGTPSGLLDDTQKLQTCPTSRDSSNASHVSLTEVTAARSNSNSPKLPGVSSTQRRFSKSVEKLKILGQQHDAKNQQHLSKWETFMGNVERNYSKNQFHAEDDHELFGFKASRLRWAGYGSSWFFNSTDDEKRSESRYYKELLQLVNEEGIPPRYRNMLWLQLSGAHNKSVPGEFQRLIDLCHEASDPKIKENIEQINLDLHRTLSSNKFFFNVEKSQPGPHFYKLQNILYAFTAYNPDIGYSQGMNRVVGNLLLGVTEGSNHGTSSLGEEDIFWIFVCIVEELLPKYNNIPFYHQDALPFIQQDVCVSVNYYLEKLLPKLYHHLSRLHIEIEIIVLGWWLGLFTEAANTLDLWFHVVDGLMLADDPGVKIVTYSIATFKLFERNLMDLNSTDTIYEYFSRLKSGCAANIRLTDFVSTCSSIGRKISQSKLQDLRSANDSNGLGGGNTSVELKS